jgi:hypothetical protein
MGRSCSTHVRMRNVYKGLYRKPERLKPLGTHLCRWTLKISFWGAGTVFVSGCKVKMGICEHSNDLLGTIKSRYFLYFHRVLNTFYDFEVCRQEICTEQLLWVRCNDKQLQQGEHTLFHVWCCTAMTDKRYDGFTELCKFRESFTGSIW